MKWRAMAAASGGLLLAVPLLLTVGIALDPGRNLARKEDERVVPVLSWEERRRLMTHERDCQSREDCERPLECLLLNPGGMSICADSECTTDVQCGEGYVCRAMHTLGGGLMVRACLPEGRKKEGQPCMQGVNTRDHGCEEGLLCQQGWCGRPCQLDTLASCPEGFFCKPGPDGPSCLPTCEGRTCPEGQQCMRYKAGVSVCAMLRGVDCEAHPCPEGQRCASSFPWTKPEGLLVGKECVQPCGKQGHGPCPEGLVCSRKECRRPCERDVPGTCDPEEVCRLNPTGSAGVCRLRYRR